MQRHADAARRLAGEGHAIRVATESPDVVADPPQGQVLIPQPQVSGQSGRGGAEEAEDAQSELNHHDDDVLIRHQLGGREAARPLIKERSSVDPHEDRQSGRRAGPGGNEDVEVQAVLAHPLPHLQSGAGLSAHRRRTGGVEEVVGGGRWRLSLEEAACTDRGRSVGNPQVAAVASATRPLQIHPGDVRPLGGDQRRCFGDGEHRHQRDDEGDWWAESVFHHRAVLGGN